VDGLLDGNGSKLVVSVLGESGVLWFLSYGAIVNAEDSLEGSLGINGALQGAGRARSWLWYYMGDRCMISRAGEERIKRVRAIDNATDVT
jgi:hypothetical protein